MASISGVLQLSTYHFKKQYRLPWLLQVCETGSREQQRYEKDGTFVEAWSWVGIATRFIVAIQPLVTECPGDRFYGNPTFEIMSTLR